ncbi:hypothetical protein ABZW18_16000 [Streptomyces sp. NPDC004647]|uniref:hypothetical protein n=1 Tax=Streptomyces sp. NPDC004647 TaxID=3154671 RepID=UPI0033B92105
MDQGLAALIAGVAALVGALASGWYTGRSSRLGAEKAAKAALQQVAEQGAVEHEQWLRDQRQDAHLAFTGELDRAIALVANQVVEVAFQHREPESASMDAARAGIRVATERVVVLGPEEVELEAKLVEEALTDVLDWVRHSALSEPAYNYLNETSHRLMMFHFRRDRYLHAYRNTLRRAPGPQA